MTTFVLDQTPRYYSLEEICERCATPASIIEEFIELGIIEPVSPPSASDPQISAKNYLRLRKALRIHQDLAVNPAGVALVMDLLDEVQTLRRQLRMLTDG